MFKSYQQQRAHQTCRQVVFSHNQIRTRFSKLKVVWLVDWLIDLIKKHLYLYLHWAGYLVHRSRQLKDLQRAGFLADRTGQTQWCSVKPRVTIMKQLCKEIWEVVNLMGNFTSNFKDSKSNKDNLWVVLKSQMLRGHYYNKLQTTCYLHLNYLHCLIQ